MSKIIVKDYEDINRALRRFKKKVEESGVLDDLRKNEFYEKPTTKRKRKKGAAVNRYKKKIEKEQLPPRQY